MIWYDTLLKWVNWNLTCGQNLKANPHYNYDYVWSSYHFLLFMFRLIKTDWIWITAMVFSRGLTDYIVNLLLSLVRPSQVTRINDSISIFCCFCFAEQPQQTYTLLARQTDKQEKNSANLQDNEDELTLHSRLHSRVIWVHLKSVKKSIQTFRNS